MLIIPALFNTYEITGAFEHHTDQDLGSFSTLGRVVGTA